MNTALLALLVIGIIGSLLSLPTLTFLLLAWLNDDEISDKTFVVCLAVFLFTTVCGVAGVKFHTTEGSIRKTCVERGEVLVDHKDNKYSYFYKLNNGCIKEQDEIFIKGKWRKVTKKVGRLK